MTDSFSACTAIAPLAEYLASHGWRSIIACSDRRYDDAHPFAATLRRRGLDVRRIDISRRISPVLDVARIVELWALIRRERPSLVHTHLAKGGVVGRISAWLAGTPCVHTVYDYAFVDHAGGRRWIYRTIERAAASFACRTMFISENERQIGLMAGIGDPDRMVTVGMGADPRFFDPANVSREQIAQVRGRFNIPEDRLVVGAVGRLIQRKGMDLLLQAAAMLPQAAFDWHLLIAGGGPLESVLTELASRLGIGDRVSFTGFIEEPELLAAIFASMDVFCLPSRREGYGVVYAEASAMQRPVVAPDLPPMNCIVVHGKTGLLSEPEDPNSIVVALQRLLSSEELRISMGREGRAFITRYGDVEDAHRRTVAVYEDAIASNPLISGAARRGPSPH